MLILATDGDGRESPIWDFAYPMAKSLTGFRMTKIHLLKRHHPQNHHKWVIYGDINICIHIYCKPSTIMGIDPLESQRLFKLNQQWWNHYKSGIIGKAEPKDTLLILDGWIKPSSATVWDLTNKWRFILGFSTKWNMTVKPSLLWM